MQTLWSQPPELEEVGASERWVFSKAGLPGSLIVKAYHGFARKGTKELSLNESSGNLSGDKPGG